MAERSVHTTVVNFTGRTWQRAGLSLEHGIWENNDALVPPEQIPPLLARRAFPAEYTARAV